MSAPNPTPCPARPGELPDQRLDCARRGECLAMLVRTDAASFHCRDCHAHQPMTRAQVAAELAPLAALGRALADYRPDCGECGAKVGEKCATAGGATKGPCPGRRWPVPLARRKFEAGELWCELGE